MFDRSTEIRLGSRIEGHAPIRPASCERSGGLNSRATGTYSPALGITTGRSKTCAATRGTAGFIQRPEQRQSSLAEALVAARSRASVASVHQDFDGIRATLARPAKATLRLIGRRKCGHFPHTLWQNKTDRPGSPYDRERISKNNRRQRRFQHVVPAPPAHELVLAIHNQPDRTRTRNRITPPQSTARRTLSSEAAGSYPCPIVPTHRGTQFVDGKVQQAIADTIR